MIAFLFGIIFIIFASYATFNVIIASFQRRRSPIEDLPGPPNPSIIFGHLRQMISTQKHISNTLEEWVGRYGDTFATRGPLNVSSILRPLLGYTAGLISGTGTHRCNC
jgi:hypothetical protein